MADDDLRLEPKRLELAGSLGDGSGAGDRLFQVAGVGVDGGLVARRHLVGDLADAGDDILVRLADEDDVVLLRGQQVAHQMKELPWKILVNEQEAHGPTRVSPGVPSVRLGAAWQSAWARRPVRRG